MPQIPLPTTAQLTAIIDAIEPTILQPLAQPLTWLRDRLDPFHAAEQEEKKSDQKEDGHLSEEESEGCAESKREIKRGVKGEAIVPYKFKDSTFKKMSTAVGQEKLKKEMERQCRPRRQDEINLMGHTYHHHKLDLEKRQQPHFTKIEKKEDYEPRVMAYGEKYAGSLKVQPGSKRDRKDRISQPIDQKEKSGSGDGQQRKIDSPTASAELETMEVPTVLDHPLDVKIRLYPEEEARVARELEEAMANNFFKLWPVKTETEPEIDDSKKPDESREFRAPLSGEAQSRKLELMNQWKSKEEKDNQARARTQERADYEDDEMMDMLMGTSMFKPTLAPYVGTGKKIPTREEVLAEYEGTASVYEDALEVLPASKNNKDTSKTQEKLDKRSSYHDELTERNPRRAMRKNQHSPPKSKYS
jgi:hypothetical protein